jgi:hypothetical protein
MRAMILRADHLTEDEMRAADGRDALETEAKLRASREREEQQQQQQQPIGAAAGSGDQAEEAPEEEQE